MIMTKEEPEGEKKLPRGRVNRSRTRSVAAAKKKAPTTEESSPRRELSLSGRGRVSRTKSGRQRTLNKLARTRTSLKLEEKKRKT